MVRNKKMQILVKCPKCGQRFYLNEQDVDKRKRCLRCRRLFKVPKLDQLDKALKVLDQANNDVFVDEQGKTYG